MQSSKAKAAKKGSPQISDKSRKESSEGLQVKKSPSFSGADVKSSG